MIHKLEIKERLIEEHNIRITCVYKYLLMERMDGRRQENF